MDRCSTGDRGEQALSGVEGCERGNVGRRRDAETPRRRDEDASGGGRGLSAQHLDHRTRSSRRLDISLSFTLQELISETF